MRLGASAVWPRPARHGAVHCDVAWGGDNMLPLDKRGSYLFKLKFGGRSKVIWRAESVLMRCLTAVWPRSEPLAPSDAQMAGWLSDCDRSYNVCDWARGRAPVGGPRAVGGATVKMADTEGWGEAGGDRWERAGAAGVSAC